MQLDRRVDGRKLTMTLAIALVSAGMLLGSGDFPRRVALFPMVISTIILVLAALDLVRILRPAVRPESDLPGPDAVDSRGSDSARVETTRATSTAGAIGWFLALIIPILLFGFLIAVPLYMALFLRLQGKHSWRTVVVSVAGIWVVIAFGFVRLLNLPIYGGYLL